MVHTAGRYADLEEKPSSLTEGCLGGEIGGGKQHARADHIPA